MVQGTITTLAYGGKGILRTNEGVVLFVPFTVPGDEIECRITRMKKNYGEAVLEKILIPSQDRVAPLCPYFGVCGGCQLQHLTYAAQIKHKKGVVQDALSRIFPKVEVEISKANPLWAYRTHVTMTLKPQERMFIAGYFAEDNTTLIQVEECPIFCEKNDPILKLAGAFAKELLPEDTSRGKLKILKDMDQKHILAFHFKKMPRNFASLAKKFLADPIVGMSASSVKETLSFGRMEMQFSIDKKSFIAQSNAFLQAHPEQSKEIYKCVNAYLEHLSLNSLIDLYCGIGISSILASPYVRSIKGVEMNKKAVEIAKVNAAANGAENVEFKASKVEDVLDLLLKKNPDSAIINPPREGLSKEIAEKLAESKIKYIFYISCQPQTLARDLAILKRGGFSLQKAQAFDMFPETGHVETLVILERT